MEEWKEYKLGDLYDVHNGLSKGGKFFGSGYPFLSFSTVFKNYFLPNELTNLVQSSEKEQANFNIKEGDVFITRTSESADELGLSSVALKDYPNATYNGFTKRLRPKGVIEISSKYIGYYLRSPKFRSNFYKLTSAMSTRASLANNDLLNMIVSVPSLTTQQKIANILSSLDDKIEVNRRINEQLEELAQALFKSWFVDFEPFKDGEFVESELEMIPEGWKVGTFSDVVDSTLGGDWGKETEQGNYTKEVFCIRGADIPEIKNGNRGKMPIRFILQKNYEKKSLNNNDLVVEISGGSPTQSTGRICRVTSELLEKYNNSLICTNFCRAIKPLAKYSAYIYYYWQHLYDKGAMFNYENGTTGIKNLMINDILEKEPIIIPSIDVVEQYNNVVETFAIKIQKNGEEIEKLSNLRDTLLPKLMSGEIDVNEVET